MEPSCQRIASKRYLCKCEDIDSENHAHTNLYLSVSSRSPIDDTQANSILAHAGLGRNPEDPLAFVINSDSVVRKGVSPFCQFFLARHSRQGLKNNWADDTVSLLSSISVSIAYSIESSLLSRVYRVRSSCVEESYVFAHLYRWLCQLHHVHIRGAPTQCPFSEAMPMQIRKYRHPRPHAYEPVPFRVKPVCNEQRSSELSLGKHRSRSKS
jgi:hypothetical protein